MTDTNPQTLAQLIALVESSNNQFAMRHEPAFKNYYQKDIQQYAKIAGVTNDTAEICLASSWGLYQIMGINLLRFGLQISFVHYCCAIDVQLLYFNKFLQQNKLAQYAAMPLDQFMADESALMDFAIRYNGPGNPAAYAARMKLVGGA